MLTFASRRAIEHRAIWTTEDAARGDAPELERYSVPLGDVSMR
jgi:hypothetical protein